MEEALNTLTSNCLEIALRESERALAEPDNHELLNRESGLNGALYALHESFVVQERLKMLQK